MPAAPSGRWSILKKICRSFSHLQCSLMWRPGANMELAILGAQVFFIGRLAYVPLYLSGIPFLRSTAYGVGFVGNVVMAWALMGS